MKRFYLLWILLLPIKLLALNIIINGSVVNASSSTPVVGAKVFINRTTLFTLTNDSGSFQLSNVKDSGVELVVYYPGFHTLVYKISADKPAINIRFEMVEIKKDPLKTDSIVNTQQEQLFIEYFIGKSFNAAETQILNPDVLRYQFNDTTGLFTVTAVDMLNIINDGLGYFINYQLETFILNINSGFADVQGYCFFKELNTQKPFIEKKWAERRMITYDGSLMHFMRSLYLNTTEKEGFKLRLVTRVSEDEEGFKDGLKLKNKIRSGKIIINQKEKEFVDYYQNEELTAAQYLSRNEANHNILFSSRNPILVAFKTANPYINSIANINRKEHRSILYLTPAGVLVEKNGLYFETENLFIEGALHEQVGDLIPIDYHP